MGSVLLDKSANSYWNGPMVCVIQDFGGADGLADQINSRQYLRSTNYTISCLGISQEMFMTGEGRVVLYWLHNLFSQEWIDLTKHEMIKGKAQYKNIFKKYIISYRGSSTSLFTLSLFPKWVFARLKIHG